MIAVLAVGVVLLAGTLLRGQLLETYEAQLTRELRLAEVVVRSPRFDDRNADEVAGAITERIGYRVSIIAADGRVLGDSYVPTVNLPNLDDHSTRPEVVGALGGSPSFATRRSVTVDERLFYGALPIEWRGERAVLRIAAPLEEIDATVRSVQGAVAGAGILATLLALILAYGVSRVITRPLVILGDRARELAAGDFSVRASRYSRVVELDRLAASFNRLADELQGRLSELGRERDETEALIDSIAEGVIALTEDARVLRVNRAAATLLGIPEDFPAFAPIGTLVRQPELRDRLENAVVDPFEAEEVTMGRRSLLVSSRLLERGGAVVTFLDVTEIRRLEQVRRDFVANASHELKTPLTSMRGFAETLLDGEPPEHLRREFLNSIRTNTVRLQNLVDDLLDLSRLESGGWVARPEPVEVASAAWDAWDELGEKSRTAEVDFTVEGEGFALADGNGLNQIFQNLFDNSLRYTPPEGSIAVRIGQEDGDLKVAVADTGSGIPGKVLPRIFERFYRVDPARSREAGGTGLGLAIVRHLVQAMGGEVWAESQLGQGTTIHFTLPRPTDLDILEEPYDEEEF